MRVFDLERRTTARFCTVGARPVTAMVRTPVRKREHAAALPSLSRRQTTARKEHAPARSGRRVLELAEVTQDLLETGGRGVHRRGDILIADERGLPLGIE